MRWISPLLLSLYVVTALSACSSKDPIMVWWNRVNLKAHHILRVEAEYEALKKEHEILVADYYKLESQYLSLLAETKTKTEVRQNLQATGSKTGRSPASIKYRVPEGLDLEQKSALAFEHMREKRFEEAAITFDSFLWEPEGAAAQTSGAFYAAGVAWFKLENYKNAKKCFAEAALRADADERVKVNKKVNLWMRVLNQKLGGE